MKYIYYPLVLLALLLSSNLFTACNDDEDGGNGMPVIHYLRVTDPALADSTFTDVNPGVMIVAIGENLTGVKEVYINDQSVSFNSNYSTPTSLIITVPSDLLLTGANPELTGELRIVTTHGTATFAMHVLSPAPYITRLAISSYPVQPGDQILLEGSNFYEIERIYLTELSMEEIAELPEGSEIPVAVEITEYTVNRDYDELTITVPQGVIEEGTLVVDCYTASAYTDFSCNALPPVINGINSMMPVTGTEVTINGLYFINVESVTMGDVVVEAEDLTVSEAQNQITFTMPAAPSGTCNLVVEAAGGAVELEGFYPKENIVLDYDDIGGFSWGGCAVAITANGTSAPYFSDGVCYQLMGNLSAWNGWWGQLQNDAVWTIAESVLPSSTPLADLALQFECYVAKEFGEGPVCRIYLRADEAHNLTGYVPVSDFTGRTEVGQWMQCSIPMTSLADESTWGDFLALPTVYGGQELAIQITNSGETAYDMELYFDNFRVVPMPAGAEGE